MNEEELNQVRYLVECMRGELAAMRAVQDALLGTICISLPPGTGELTQAYLEVTSRIHRAQLAPEAADKFDNAIADARQMLSSPPPSP